MNCNDVKKHLMAYHDGELDQTLALEVEAALAGCPECATELAELRLVHTFASDAFTATTPEPDFSGLYDAVMARVAVEEQETVLAIEGVRVQRAAAEPGLLERVGAWFGELFRFERPYAALAGVAALVAVAVGFWYTGSASNSAQSGPAVASGQHDKMESASKRRGREGEVAVRNAWVEDSIATVGEVKVITFDETDEQPLVLWHVVEGEGVSLPAAAANTPGQGL